MNRSQLHAYLSAQPTDQEFAALAALESGSWKDPRSLTADQLALWMKFYSLNEELGRDVAQTLINRMFPV
jgi:hypothetical protein